MDAKQAVNLAKIYLQDLLEDERISNLGLEEVEFDESRDSWLVTVGFSRPWDTPRAALAALAQGAYPTRSYKVVRINDVTEKVISVKNREIKG